jgi:glycosyltransferase involved in cell wall biosynthesis
MNRVSILIKTYNEERYIARAIESALTALRTIPGEVIVADSGSSDRTAEIAATYPVRVVQFANPNDRSCGATAQLAFQHSVGEFVYLLDGDMVLDAAFLSLAVNFLERHADVAGVGGAMREMHTDNIEFLRRRMRLAVDMAEGDVDRLNGGGLYRREAIRQIGHFADRNLHAYEEFDLGMRLRSRNWRLVRLSAHAVCHFSHRMRSYPLLWYRLRNGYAMGSGEIIRGAWGRSHFWSTLSRLRELRLWFAVMAWWLAVAVALGAALLYPLSVTVAIGLLAAPFVAMSRVRRSAALGVYAVVSWNVYTVGLILGFARRRVSPSDVIHAVILRDIEAT